MSQLPAMRALDDRALVNWVLAGDEAAFGALVDRHHASLLRVAGAWACHRHADAAVREAWSSMLDAVADFRLEVPVRAWLMRIAARLARAYPCPRSAPDTRRVSYGDLFDAEGRWTDPPVAWNERSSTERDASSAIGEALAGLSPMGRAVFTLRDVERLGAEEARFVLDLGAPAERALLAAAREHVRRVLDASLRAPATAAPLARPGACG